jgi:hypothetical protein
LIFTTKPGHRMEEARMLFVTETSCNGSQRKSNP